jgi:hypothetical protein
MLGCVPFFMDRHEFKGLTALYAASMHLKDLALAGPLRSQLLTFWFDYERQSAFCLAKGPTGEAGTALHRESHGAIPNHTVVTRWPQRPRLRGGPELARS